MLGDISVKIIWESSFPLPSRIRPLPFSAVFGSAKVDNVLIVIAKNTIDETYYWIGKRKMSASKGMGDKMTKVLEKNQEIVSKKTGLDAFI